MLFIEYDVSTEGEIELVALINAIEEDGQDPDGEAWWVWRSSSKMEAWAALALLQRSQGHGGDGGPR